MEAFFEGEPPQLALAAEGHRPLPSECNKRALSFDNLLKMRAEGGGGPKRRRRGIGR